MKICLLALAGIATLFATPADAASRSVWVSRNGSNISGCGTVSKPCATFQFAHDNALAATGVINVLDSGDYGPITITKPMSILNTGGAMAVIAASSGESAVTINAPADAAIVLRGLTLVGGDRGRHGIVFNTGVSLAVSDCVIERFRTNGLYVRPNGSGTVHLSLARLRVADNGVVGILIEPRQTVAVHGAIADVEATHNGSRGIFVSGEKSAAASANILMRDINASGSFSDGIASVGAGTTVTTTRTIGTGNQNGLGRYNGFTGTGKALPTATTDSKEIRPMKSTARRHSCPGSDCETVERGAS
jgi:hypothetical protein